MRIAFVGCGYVADLYATTLRNHPSLELASVYDRDPARLAAFAAHWRVRAAASLEDVLSDPAVELVVNLTNPASHYEVTKVALEAGKHVYSEKPLALSLAHADELVSEAESRGLQLAGAPCALLGEAAQTAWKALRDGRIGTPRLAYAELDDGPIHLLRPETWRSASGAPWPWRNELEVGSALEHAGYYVSWLLAFFGPVASVTAFNRLVLPDKGIDGTPSTPDFAVGCLEHESGVVSRLTCSIYATHDHSLRVFGDAGGLYVGDCWDYGARVAWYPRRGLAVRAERRLSSAQLAGRGLLPIGLARRPRFRWRSPGATRMDLARGIAETAEAATEGRANRLSARFSLHLNEVCLALAGAEGGRTVRMATRCEPPAPMPWAR
jgi:predicted dehydrogenase